MQARLQRFDNLAVGRRERVVRLVSDDGVEFAGSKRGEALVARKRLDGRRDDRFALAVLGAFFDADRDVVVFDGLADEFVAMRDDEHAPAAFDGGENDRFAQAGCHVDQVRPAFEGVDDVDALLLIRAQAKGHRGHLLGSAALW